MAVFLKQVINILPILITAVLLLFDVSAASIAQKVYCGPGQQLEEGLEDANEHCAPCPPGFYQDRNHHRITSCHKCASFSDYDARRRLVDNCTPYHDTVVRCVEGFYYVYDPIGGDCLTCTNCPSQGKYEIQACSDTENAICCDKEDMMVKNGTCVETLVCGPGQFLVPAQADREEECKQCGLESSNPEVHHRKRSCGQTQDATDTDDEGGEKESRDKETGDFRLGNSKSKHQNSNSPAYVYLVGLIPLILLFCYVFKVHQGLVNGYMYRRVNHND